MSKERLEGIKKRLSAPFLKLGRMNGKTQLFNDLQWLIEQVDNIHSHAPEGRNYTNKQYVDLLTDYNNLLAEREELWMSNDDKEKEILVLKNKIRRLKNE